MIKTCTLNVNMVPECNKRHQNNVINMDFVLVWQESTATKSEPLITKQEYKTQQDNLLNNSYSTIHRNVDKWRRITTGEEHHVPPGHQKDVKSKKRILTKEWTSVNGGLIDLTQPERQNSAHEADLAHAQKAVL